MAPRLNTVAMVALCFVSASSWLRAEITIIRTDPVIEQRTFDPKNPPPDMPKLNPNEAAVAQSYFGADARIGGNVIEQERVEGSDLWTSAIKVEAVRMTLKMRVTIWLPEHALAKTVSHEEGHRQIAERFYDDAERIARDLARGMIGQTIRGTGADGNASANNALHEAALNIGRQYLAHTDAPCGDAQVIYDRLTAHGTNALREEQAIKQAIDQIQRDRATTQPAQMSHSR